MRYVLYFPLKKIWAWDHWIRCTDALNHVHHYFWRSIIETRRNIVNDVLCAKLVSIFSSFSRDFSFKFPIFLSAHVLQRSKFYKNEIEPCLWMSFQQTDMKFFSRSLIRLSVYPTSHISSDIEREKVGNPQKTQKVRVWREPQRLWPWPWRESVLSFCGIDSFWETTSCLRTSEKGNLTTYM
jgi:hypothetical protein